MKMDKKKIISRNEILKGESHYREATFIPSTTEDKDTLTFVMVSNQSGGTRFNWDKYEYYEEVLQVSGANTDKLNTFFKDHNRGVDDAIGNIKSVSNENGELLAEVSFDADGLAIKRKYENGTLSDVSIGYIINAYSVEEREGDIDLVTVADFDIVELSAVGIGLDRGAKYTGREAQTKTGEEEMLKELMERLDSLEKVSKRTTVQETELTSLRKSFDDAKKEDEAKEMKRLKDENLEMKRVNEMNEISTNYKASKELTEQFRAKGTGSEFMKAILDERAAKEPTYTPAGEPQSRASVIEAMVDGLALRSGAKLKDPHADANKYRFAPLIAIGNELLPKDKRSMIPTEIAERSLLTGDFPLLLQSVGARVLESEFASASATYQSWITEVDVPDFRVMTDVTAKIGGGRLSKTLENGDLEELAGVESGETWNIEPFGNKFVLTREMLINDDLGAFTSLLATFGEMAKTTANGIAYDLLQNKGDYANYKMADGSGMYISARNNSTTAKLSPEALNAGVLAMSKHKALDGKTPLNITPRYLVVGANSAVMAREIVGATNKISTDANTGEINIHQGAYEVIVDSEIADDSWFLLADRRTLKIGYLAGTNRSPIVKMNDTTLIRTTYEGVFDLGVMAEDYKGIYRSTGTA